MEAQVSSRDNFCTFVFFDCLKSKEDAADEDVTGAVHFASLRETPVHHQQPHLVEPMKLTVYEDLPTTPLSATLSRPFYSRSRHMSGLSPRASLFSLRTRLSKQIPFISKPVLQAERCNDLPLRRRREFSPLELSIYVDRNRLSDLPAFDRLSFTDFGELKNLDRILSRPQSAVLPPLKRTPLLYLEDPPKSVSMYEIGNHDSVRPQTSYSTISMSRPPSEYDALHSHPVSWASLPGLSIVTTSHKTEKSVAILTPMEEEFPTEATLTSVKDVAMLLRTDEKQLSTDSIIEPPPQAMLAAPASVAGRESQYESYQTQFVDTPPVPRRSSRRSYCKQSIAQWLAMRNRTNSTSSVASIETTASSAEHRRKRSEFYQLGKSAQVDNHITLDALETSDRNDVSPSHKRTVTGSTIASTVDTEILSYTDDRSSIDTCTYTPEVLKSQSGTIKSITSPGGRKVVTSNITDVGLLTPMRGQVFVVDDESPYPDDIRGRLRAPSIGMAF